VDKEHIELFIQASKKINASDEEIRQLLLNKGVSDQDIENALQHITTTTSVQVNTPSDFHISMWDTFEHVLMFITLYILAVSVTLTLKFFVNTWLPDPVYARNTISFSNTYMNTILWWYLSAIIVAEPLFAFFFLNITKRTLQNPNIRQLRTRKTLTYLTLIFTFLVLLTYLIVTIYTLISGNITLNYCLNALIPVVISGTIFLYYFLQIKEDKTIQ